MTGASCALHLSDLVWAGPLAGVRIGRIDGEFVANPTFAEREKSDMDIVVAASKDAIMMVEGEMHEMQENVVIDALLFAHQAVQPLIELQERLRAANGKDKRPFTPPVVDENLEEITGDNNPQVFLANELRVVQYDTAVVLRNALIFSS